MRIVEFWLRALFDWHFLYYFHCTFIEFSKSLLNILFRVIFCSIKLGIHFSLDFLFYSLFYFCYNSSQLNLYFKKMVMIWILFLHFKECGNYLKRFWPYPWRNFCFWNQFGISASEIQWKQILIIFHFFLWYMSIRYCSTQKRLEL